MAKTYEQIRSVGTFIKNTTTAKSVTNQIVGENIEDIADKMMSLDNGLKGYFTTIDSLLLAFPNPQIGWTAWVGAAYPGTVYDVVSGAWHNTTVVPPAEEVNLEDYLQKSSIVQEKGYSETDVMSQKAVTDELIQIESDLSEIDDKTDINTTKVNKVLNSLMDLEATEPLYICDKNGLVKMSITNEGVNSDSFNIKNASGVTVFTLNKAFFDSIAASLDILSNDVYTLDSTVSSQAEKIESSDLSIKDILKYLFTSLSTDTFSIVDNNGLVKMSVSNEGVNTDILNIKNENGITKGSINIDFFKTIFTDIYDTTGASSPDNNYAGEFYICDKNGLVAFKIDSQGNVFFTGSGSTNLTIIPTTISDVATVKSNENYARLYFKTSNWAGKRILYIGDSITAAGNTVAGEAYWPKECSTILGTNTRIHAKGGIGLIEMVDGDGSGEAPEGTDPDDFGSSIIYALNAADVTNVDLIIIAGIYNERGKLFGSLSDLYPANNTLSGVLNYAINRVYEELANANNMTCKVVIAGPHCFGKYPYSDADFFEPHDIGLTTGVEFNNMLKSICENKAIPFIDVANKSGINKYNWDTYQSSGSNINSSYIPADQTNYVGGNSPFETLTYLQNYVSPVANYYATVGTLESYEVYQYVNSSWTKQYSPLYPWNGDQLHLNSILGYKRLGQCIAININNL